MGAPATIAKPAKAEHRLTTLAPRASREHLPARRMLTAEGTAFYRRVDTALDDLREFPHGDAFFGRIVSVEEDDRRIHARVELMVAKERLGETGTINIVDGNGKALPFPMVLEHFSNVEENRLLSMTLKKPGNVSGQSFSFTVGMFVTSNGPTYDFRRKVRAFYDDTTVTVYQAFKPEIAEEAVSRQHFGSALNPQLRTWIKPSLLWLATRSGWATKPGQERILSIALARRTFEALLRRAKLADPTLGLSHETEEEYRAMRHSKPNFVQWDPDRDFNGNRKRLRAIQIGVAPSDHALYNGGILEIEDITENVARAQALIKHGRFSALHMPPEAPYPTPVDFLRTLEMHQYFAHEDRSILDEIALKV